MPPKFKFSKDEITKAAFNITKERGMSGLTARALAERLGCSVKPIFGLFKNMEEVQQEVLKYANELYQSYLAEDMATGEYPTYKASGIAYIRFAKDEKELFKLLFMRDRSSEQIGDEKSEIKSLIEIIMMNTGLSEQDSYMFHLEMWVYVHGIATMIATSYLEWNWDTISQMLTDGYMGLRQRYCGKEAK